MRIKKFDKYSVFLTSTGRTGTQFMARMMSKMIDDFSSFHEPGTLWFTRPHEWLEQINRYGLYHMTIGQARPTHSMFKLSTDRYTKKISDEKAKEYIYNMRKPLIDDVNRKIYMESSGHIYALVDLIAEVFPNSKFIFIIRDPRTWVRSALNTIEYIIYKPLDIDFLNISIKAKDMNDDPYNELWSEMSIFEKYCWYYDKVNSFIMNKFNKLDNVMFVRFEDLFNKKTKNETFKKLLSFSSHFRDGFESKYEFKADLLNRKVHSNANKKKFPKWQHWDNEMALTLKEHCGKWMKKYNYGNEPLWQKKIANNKIEFIEKPTG